MATKIRLQRFGKKGKPFYHIVAADSKSKRDGRCIERIGSYNPNTTPATININHDRALYWIQVGAIPTDTARTILSYTGVLMKKHLLDGVKKEAHTEEQAIKKFETWLEEKAKKISEATNAIEKIKADTAAKALEFEKIIRANREAEIKAKNIPETEGKVIKEETKIAEENSITKEHAVVEEPTQKKEKSVTEGNSSAEKAKEEKSVTEGNGTAEQNKAVNGDT